MTLKDWENNGWLIPQASTPNEIVDLLKAVDRDLADVKHGLSADTRFFIAYTAALRLCAMLLRVSGYRAARNEHHFRTIMAMPLILGSNRNNDADYLNTCRKKRNKGEYYLAGAISDQEADTLYNFATAFRADVVKWFNANYPDIPLK